MDVKKIPVPSISPASTKVPGSLWAGIRDARSPTALLTWIKNNMTGDQLIPNWGEHKQAIWFDKVGAILPSGGSESDDVAHLCEYLQGIYRFWFNKNGNLWTGDEISSRINAILEVNSRQILSAPWNTELTQDQKNHNNAAKIAGRYAFLAEDYFNHIKASSTFYAILFSTSKLTTAEFQAIAIYSSAQFAQMLGIARGHNRNVQFEIGKAQDLWFLTYATVGIKKLASIETAWYNQLLRPALPPPLSSDAGTVGYLRRDMDLTDQMIEDLFRRSEYVQKGDYLFPPDSDADSRIFSDKGMMSTTYDIDGAAPYNTNSNVTLFIKVDTSKAGEYSAVPLEKISRLPLEKEILWAPGTQFKIRAMRDNRKTTTFKKPGGSDWRDGSRGWSITEKLWIYLEAPLKDEVPRSDDPLSHAKIFQLLRKISFTDLIGNALNLKFDDSFEASTSLPKIKNFLKNFLYLHIDGHGLKDDIKRGTYFASQFVEISRLFKGAVRRSKNLSEINLLISTDYVADIDFRVRGTGYNLSPSQKLAFSIYSSSGFGWIVQSGDWDLQYKNLSQWVISNVEAGFYEIFNNPDISKRPKEPFILPQSVFRVDSIFSLTNYQEVRNLAVKKATPRATVRNLGLTTISTTGAKPVISPAQITDYMVVWQISCQNSVKGAFINIYKGVLWKPSAQFELTHIDIANPLIPADISLTALTPTAQL